MKILERMGESLLELEDVFATGTKLVFHLDDLIELGDCDIVGMTERSWMKQQAARSGSGRF